MVRVLVIAPHPDDEAIGCGGTICRHVAAGDEVGVIFLTSGEKGGHGRSEAETIRIREAESAAAAQILQIADYAFWHEPDGAVKATPDLAAKLAEVFEFQRPQRVYVPHADEIHPDHLASYELVRKAINIARQRPEALLYEVWTPLQKMDHIEDISDHIETKMTAIRAYKCQNDVLAFDEAFRGLARYRGEMHSWPGGDYAEVFRRLS